MTHPAAQQGSEIGRRGWLLLALWPTAPLVWLAQLQVSYAVAAGPCDRRLLVMVALGASAAMVGVVGSVAWREWRRHRAGAVTARAGGHGSIGFIALIGMCLSVQMLAIVLLQWLAAMIVSPCG